MDKVKIFLSPWPGNVALEKIIAVQFMILSTYLFPAVSLR